MPPPAQHAMPSWPPTKRDAQVFIPHTSVPASMSGGGGVCTSGMGSGFDASGVGLVMGSVLSEPQAAANDAKARRQVTSVFVLERDGDESFIDSSGALRWENLPRANFFELRSISNRDDRAGHAPKKSAASHRRLDARSFCDFDIATEQSPASTPRQRFAGAPIDSYKWADVRKSNGEKIRAIAVL